MNSKEALIKYRMEQAKESIDDARFLLDNNRSLRLIANRAYYAMFYAILALLQSKGLGSSKHSGAIALTNEEIIPLHVILPFVKKEGGNEIFCDELLSLPYKEARRKSLDAFNIKYVTNVLNKNNGNVTKAAMEIEIERQYLQRILKKYNIISGQSKR